MGASPTRFNLRSSKSFVFCHEIKVPNTSGLPRRKILVASLALPSRHVALAAKGALLLRRGREERLRRGAKTRKFLLSFVL